MHPDKAEFKRLMEIMGWSQTEAARRLHKTPSAINHLVNPDHPNKPAQTTIVLLKLIISRERPDLIDSTSSELKNVPTGGKPEATRLSPREREMIETIRRLPAREREKIYAVIQVMLRPTGRKGGKTRQ
jgi:hypothetical protein